MDRSTNLIKFSSTISAVLCYLICGITLLRVVELCEWSRFRVINQFNVSSEDLQGNWPVMFNVKQQYPFICLGYVGQNLKLDNNYYYIIYIFVFCFFFSYRMIYNTYVWLKALFCFNFYSLWLSKHKQQCFVFYLQLEIFSTQT